MRGEGGLFIVAHARGSPDERLRRPEMGDIWRWNSMPHAQPPASADRERSSRVGLTADTGCGSDVLFHRVLPTVAPFSYMFFFLRFFIFLFISLQLSVILYIFIVFLL